MGTARKTRRVPPAAGDDIPPIGHAAKRSAWAEPQPQEDPELRRLRGQVQALTTELDHVRGQNDALRHRLPDLEARIPSVEVPEVSWKLLNPFQYIIAFEHNFLVQARFVARDENLAQVARKKMEAVLFEPERYGQDMRGERKGQRAADVARNYRLVWTVKGRTVRFLVLVSKEDPEYSPHGT